MMENFRLKVFRTVAERLSFRQAAETLYLTQPAVTQQVKILEDELGLQLFDRSGNTVKLTAAGQKLLSHAASMAEAVAAAERDMAQFKGIASGKLHIGASTTIAQYVLPRLLGEFSAAYPAIKLSVVGANTEQVVSGVVNGTFALGLIEGPAMRRELKAERFLTDELAVITSPANDGPEHEIVSAEMLSNSRLILREQGSGTRRVVETALRKAGVRISRANVIMELDSTEAIKSAVEAGLGIGFVPRRAIHKELKLGTVTALNVQGLKIERRFLIVHLRGSQPDASAAAFLRFAHLVRDPSREISI
jgi:LysR family transcriptional regulator, transcriptional activator of the cysJI operon